MPPALAALIPPSGEAVDAEAHLDPLIALIDEEGLDTLLEALKQQTGFDVHILSRYRIRRHLAWRMHLNRIEDVDTYRERVSKHPGELTALCKSLLDDSRRFFRDPEHLAMLERDVLPNLYRFRSGGERIRILCFGCFTGEEAYSLSMLFHQHAEQLEEAATVEVLALDPDGQALDIASEGFFPHIMAEDVSPACLDRYFVPEEEGFRINEQIRSSVQFIKHNLTDPLAYSEVDLVVCRNVFPYAALESKEQLVLSFNRVLRTEGYLLTGSPSDGETIHERFEEIDSAFGLYRRKEAMHVLELHREPDTGDPLPAFETESDEPLGREEAAGLARILEEELEVTRSTLEMTVEEYEAAREELVSINKSLQSSLEEVLSGKEQLQVEHDALRVVCDELQKNNFGLKERNEKLEQAYSHLDHLLASCGVGVMLVNQALCIQLYTPGVQDVLGTLQPEDIGRPVMHLGSSLGQKIAEDASNVLRSLTTLEREVKTPDDRWFMIHMHPHVPEIQRVEGVVCTFMDITDQKRHEEWIGFKANILGQMHDAVIVTNKELRVTYLNDAAVTQYRLTGERVVGCRLDDVFRNIWHDPEEQQQAYQALMENGTWTGENLHITRSGEEIDVESTVSILRDDSGDGIGLLAVIRDIGPRKADSTNALRRLIADLQHRLGEDSSATKAIGEDPLKPVWEK